MCESQLCIPITWSTVLKWLNFALWKWPFSVIFWSRNVKRFWKKAEKIQTLGKKSKLSNFLNVQFTAQKTILKKCVKNSTFGK